MTADRVTKQGVPDLNDVGHNGHKNHGTSCRHWFAGAQVVIGTRWTADRDYFEAYEENIYGRRCMWCPAVKELG